MYMSIAKYLNQKKTLLMIAESFLIYLLHPLYSQRTLTHFTIVKRILYLSIYSNKIYSIVIKKADFSVKRNQLKVNVGKTY